MLKISPTSALAQVIVAGLLGLIALPALLSGGATEGAAGGNGVPLASALWLVLGLALSVWLLAMVPGLASGLSHMLARLQEQEGTVMVRRPAVRAGAEAAARLIVAVGEVTVIRAILGRPVVLVLGAAGDPSTVDAAFAAGTLTLLLLILIWLHRTARPLIEAAAWQALDALVATSGSEGVAAALAEADTELATVLAATQAGGTLGGATTRSVGSSAATVLASGDVPTQLASSETVLAPTNEATLRAPSEATLMRAGEADLSASSEATMAEADAATHLALRREPVTEATQIGQQILSSPVEHGGTRPTDATVSIAVTDTSTDETIPDDDRTRGAGPP